LSFCCLSGAGFRILSIGEYLCGIDGPPLLDLIFQRVPVPLQNFSVDTIDFDLTYIDEYDIIMYNVSFLDMNVEFSFYGMDSLNCGPDSNTDFIHFVWTTFER
jgi:hypothetical protein